MSDKIEGIRERWAEFESLDHQSQVCDAYLYMRRAHNDRATLLAEVERLHAERDALRDAAREYLTTLRGAMKAGKFQMHGTAEIAHFVRQAMRKLDSLVFDRKGPRPAGLERLHEPLKKPS